MATSLALWERKRWCAWCWRINNGRKESNKKGLVYGGRKERCESGRCCVGDFVVGGKGRMDSEEFGKGERMRGVGGGRERARKRRKRHGREKEGIGRKEKNVGLGERREKDKREKDKANQSRERRVDWERTGEEIKRMIRKRGKRREEFSLDLELDLDLGLSLGR
ncbi:hypothetical protein ACH5RR_030182 [Cinchona calisaya]|uniref:Uncharacterized protein n=1 Tax=Cinchona calisaya TaxID=153742 RepID=A0ABD2YV92_9GENT